MNPREIRTVGVMGGGVMGSGIAQTCAVSGFRVICRDLTEELLASTRDTIENGRFGLRVGVERGKVSEEQRRQALANLTLTTAVAELRDVDLVIEAITEDLELKTRAWRELDELVQPEAIFAANTTGLAISRLNQAVRRKDRFLGMIWFSPAPVMKLVELVHTPETSDKTLCTMEEVCRQLGKVSIRAKDAPHAVGFVATRIYYAAIREARQILEEGIANEEDINKAMVYGYNWPVGPLAMQQGARRGWT